MRIVETPFNMMIVGMTGCGKTQYLLEMIEKEYFGHFEYAFLICPTYDWNKTYQEWKYRECEHFYPIPCVQDHVEGYVRFVFENFKGTNSLIILDDCAQTQAVKNRVSKLVNLAFSARHYGFSTVIIMQQLTSITKPFRDNIAKLVLFYNPDDDDVQVISNKYFIKKIGKEKTKDIMQKLMAIKYTRLEIILRCPFEYELIIPNK